MTEAHFNPKSFPPPPPGKTGWPWTDASIPLPDRTPDGPPWPRISVVTPSFNQGQFIEETIRSVLLQGYPNLEYILIDGGSTDDTLAIIKKYEPWLDYWVSESDRGQSHAVNKGVLKASGDFLLWLNSDDIVLPGAFKSVSLEFNKHPNVSIIIGQARVIDQESRESGQLYSNFESWEDLITNPQNVIRQVSAFFSKEVIGKDHFLNESLDIAMDTDLLVRLTQDNRPLILEDFLTAFRTHPAAKTSTHLLRGYHETDRMRLKFSADKKVRIRYKERSCENWLNLAKHAKLSFKDRVLCLLSAVNILPSAIFTKHFWASVKKVSTHLNMKR